MEEWNDRAFGFVVASGAAFALFSILKRISVLSDENHTFRDCRGILSRDDRNGSASSIYFLNADGLRIFFRTWLPGRKKKPEGIVVLCHGFGEHSGRYEHVAGEFIRQGFVVYALDHQGHGCSEGGTKRVCVEKRKRFIPSTDPPFNERIVANAAYLQIEHIANDSRTTLEMCCSCVI